jgi:hypothetical protein
VWVSPPIRPFPLPKDALLQKYAKGPGFTDCYAAEIEGRVHHADYVTAFYTTWLFGAERQLLAWFLSKPSSDRDAHALGSGSADTFAAWRVEDRAANQLLVTDFRGATRSWLMTEHVDAASGAMTRLYFGSAVVPRIDKKTAEGRMGGAFRALLGFHRIYSHALLSAARARLERSQA